MKAQHTSQMLFIKLLFLDKQSKMFFLWKLEEHHQITTQFVGTNYLQRQFFSAKHLSTGYYRNCHI